MATQEQITIETESGRTAAAESMDHLADSFGALADPTRLRILHLLLTQGEMCVCEFMPLLSLTQSNVSFHLKALKYSGLITARKDGRWMLYRLNPKAIEDLRAEFERVFDLTLLKDKQISATSDETIRRRLACMQQYNPSTDRPDAGQGDNDHANE